MAYRKVPKRLVLAGNKALAERHIKEADRFLVEVEALASFQGLSQFRQQRELTDGTVIEAEVCFGQCKATIIAPYPKTAPAKGRPVETLGRIIVGSCLIEGQAIACLWSSWAGWERIGTLPGHVASEANAISRDGRVVVGGSANAAGEQFAFRWTREGGMEQIASLANGYQSVATGVSATGNVICGHVGLPDSDTLTAFVWTRANGMRAIMDFSPLRVTSYGWGISADGSTIVGGLGEIGADGVGLGSWGGGSGASVTYEVQPYLWNRESGLNRFAPALRGEATAISSDGKYIAGVRLLQDFFIWSQDEGFLDIPTLNGPPVWQEPYGSLPGHWHDPDLYRTNPSAISRFGAVTVGDAESIYNLNVRGFRYDRTTNTIGLIPPLPGGTFNHALGVSDDGRIVVGQSDQNGKYLGYYSVNGNPPVSLGTIAGANGSMAHDVSGLVKINQQRG